MTTLARREAFPQLCVHAAGAMPELPANAESALPLELRQRFTADLAAGRTIAIPAAELAKAEVREHLPQLLASLSKQAPPSPSRLQVPGYSVLGEIGHGGMSTVYLARHQSLGRYVALKIVPNWLGGQARARERLLTEARAMAKLSHPNIVTIHDIVEDGDTVAIAMEWVDGLTLAGLLRTLPEQPSAEDLLILRTSLGTPPQVTGRLETTVTRTFVQMMVDVAHAVHCVHQNGLLHLDIKPSNVLVRRDGTPLLADFGVVREIDLVLTHTHSFAGTPIYAAPEQLLRNDRAFGPQTDVYGLGITLYELLARCQPLRQEGLTRLLQDIQAGRIPALASRAPVPNDLANIVHRAISPEPGRRYATAAAFADDLQAFLDGRPVVARPLSRLEHARRWLRAEPWKALLAGALLVLGPVVGGLAIKLWNDAPLAHEQRLTERRAATAQLVQQAFQSFFFYDRDATSTIERLREARAADPEDTRALACLLTLLTQNNLDSDFADLVQVGTSPSAGVGMAMKRLQEHRLYFTNDEIHRLRQSNEEVDTLLLILDRILWADDADNIEEMESVGKTLDRQVLITTNDPLLLALRAWTAARTGNREALDNILHALNRNWPANQTIQHWEVISRSALDRKAAIQAAEGYMAADPTALGMRCLLSSLHNDGNEFEAALAVLNVDPLSLEDKHRRDTYRAVTLAKMGRHADAKACLPPPDPASQWPTPQQLIIDDLADPQSGRQRYHELLARDNVPLPILRHALEFAASLQDANLLESLARKACQLYPEHHGFRWRLIQALGHLRKQDEIPAVLPGLQMPRGSVDTLAPVVVPALAKQKDWQSLLATCDRWERFTVKERYRVEYYKGLALTRLGRYEEARVCFDAHFKHAGEIDRAARAVALSQGKPEPKRHHYQQAIFDLLWSLVDPKLPVEQRYPRLPSRHWPEERRVLETTAQSSSWFSLVVAEAQAADGNLEAARRSAARARELLGKPEPTLQRTWPPANLEQLIEDAIARFGK